MNEERALTGATTMFTGKTVEDAVIGRGRTASTEATDRATTFRRLADGQLHESYRLASAILGNQTDAQDAVHDAIVVGWERWSTLRDHASFEPWFRRIVVNTCRNRLRKASRRRTSDIATQPGLIAPDASPHIHQREQLEQGLARLKPDDRVLLALRYYRDLRLEDIAAVMDVPLGTIKSRLNRAHERLRVMLERANPPGADR